MAQNTLEIIIKANSSKAVSEIKKLDTTIGKISGTSAKGFDAIKAKWTELDNKLSSPGGWKIAMGAAGAAVGVLTTVGVAVKKLADDFMNYAFQVEDFGRIIGATPEEASKLIQVADDVRLSVESMTMAMRSAITKGYAPTVSELGKMSDAYLAIQDPIARSKFLIETFGRSGLEMAKLMELGSGKIDEMGASVEGTARLMTQEGILAATKYYESLDKLGESVENVEKAFGSKLVPVLAEGANTLADVADSALSSENVLTNMTQALFSQKVTVEEAAMVMGLYVTGIIDGAKANELFRGPVADSTNALIEERKAIQYATETAGGLSDSLDNVAASAGKSVSDLARMAGRIEGIPKSVQVKMDFQLPDISSRLSAWVTNKKWEEAGGAVVNKFLAGITSAMQGLDASELSAVSSKLSALELAIKIKIGAIDEGEAASQLQNLFPELKGGEATAEIKAALAIDVNASNTAIQDYLKSALTEPVEYSITPTVSDVGKTDLKAAINAITDATLPIKPVVKSEGLRADLISQITTAAGGEIPVDLLPKIKEMSTAELAALKSQIVPQPFDVKITPSIEQTDLDTLFKAIDATIPRDATTEWGKMQEKIDATGKSVQMYQGDFSTWSDTTYDIGERAREAATQVGALNTQLKSIPKNIDVKINITSSGGKGKGNTTATGEIGKPGKASGGPVSPNQWYMVGERGPELFMPNAAGRIIPNSQITNNNSADKTIYITNNYTIAAGKEINVRELARQVAREQQRAGVT